MNKNGLNISIQLILKFILIFCLLSPIILWGQYWGNENHSSNMFYELVQYSFIDIFGILGAVYVLRSLRLGVFLLIPVLCLALIKIFLYQSGFDYVYWTLFILVALFFLGFMISIMVVKDKWKGMGKGLDLKHFRHIYQLTCIFVFILLLSTVYVFLKEPSLLTDQKEEKVHSDFNTEDAFNERVHDLGDIEISLKDISYIEKHTPDLSFEQKERIMALRHLLAGHIVASNHDLKAFRNAYQLRKNDLSKEQQEVLDWFFRQHSEAHNLWKDMTSVSTIADLKRNVSKIMRDRKIKEY